MIPLRRESLGYFADLDTNTRLSMWPAKMSLARFDFKKESDICEDEPRTQQMTIFVRKRHLKFEIPFQS